jgi:lambda family phage minor tail protein L
MTSVAEYVQSGYWANGYADGDGWISILEDLQTVAPSAIIELFVLQLFPLQHGSSDTYRFHAGTSLNANGELVWAGNTYQRLPIEADGFAYQGKGQLPRPVLRVSNIYGTLSTILTTLPNGIEGAEVKRIRTLARYLDAVNFPGNVNPYGVSDPLASFPEEVFVIDRKTTENRDVIEFELAASIDLQNVLAPKRQTIANICQWRYRRWDATTSTFDYTRVDCPYAKPAYFKADGTPTTNPAEDVCGKRLTSCKLRFGTAFVTGTVTVGSTTLGSLSTTELFRINVGDEIRGFGLPVGTTVAAKAAGSLTLSQASTGSTTATTTGTRSLLGLSVTVASTTGILPGMTISGSEIPAGTRISSVDTVNRILYLNITLNPLVYLFSALFSGTLRRSPTTNTDYIDLGSTAGLVAGQYVDGGDVYQNTTISTVTALSNRINLSKLQAIDIGISKAITLRVGTPRTAVSATYTFEANTTYTIRPEATIPFGSFPAVGSIK